MSKAAERSLINDADAAGLAEMKGAGAGHQARSDADVRTGIGSALFRDGILVPNTEFGHIEIRGRDAEKRASERPRNCTTSAGASGPGGSISTCITSTG